MYKTTNLTVAHMIAKSEQLEMVAVVLIVTRSYDADCQNDIRHNSVKTFAKI